MQTRLKVLLLQARDRDDPMGEHERQCFVRHTGLAEPLIVPFDLLQGPPSFQKLKTFDVLMVGGSGDYYVANGSLPHFEASLDFFREVTTQGVPTYASCFGYQLLVAALGGKVIHDPENTEVGTYRVRLSDEAQNDELFSLLPGEFWAQFGHKDRASVQPEDIPNLAASDKSPLQALRIPGQPIWASQFHPELNRTTNLERYNHYIDGYGQYMSPKEIEEGLSRFRESPEVNELLRHFLRLITS